MVAGGATGDPVGTWTVLFTDQVGSTAMRVRVGEEVFDGIRVDLDARVTAALAAHGAVVTKSTGDGVMALSDDNTRMLVATRDGDAHVYDVDSTRQLGRTLRLDLPEGSPNLGATLRPDGRQLAAATDGVQLWDLDPDAWRDAACQLAGRNLTRDEWERHMPHGEPYQATCPQWPADT